MKSVTLQSRVGADGILKLEVPVGFADTELEVVIVVHPLNGERIAPNEPDSGWTEGFFDEAAGGWEGI